VEKYGCTETTQEKSGEMGWAKEAVTASLPRSGLLETVFITAYPKNTPSTSLTMQGHQAYSRA
jgi:hypothetical protein